jgi:1,4-alpha-glucan branching enzyme
MPLGYLALVLHSHLPFVRHPEQEFVLEEEWLYEAITETYVPLLMVFEGLKQEHIPFKVTLSLTPSLLSMLVDPLLQDRYEDYLGKSEHLAAQEYDRNTGHIRYLAEHYSQRLAQVREFWTRYQRNLVTPFRQLKESGHLDIMTSAATHAYLPLLQMYPEAVRAQLRIGCECYQKLLGSWPQGIWLPECAFYPGLDHFLAEQGLRYFITDSHGILYAKPRPHYGLYSPIFTESGVAVFGRDPECSEQVWSAEVGYPGDPDYREFYRDLGFEADYDYIKPYIMPNGERKNTGLKYYRITGRDVGLGDKSLYDPYWAKKKAADHAGNFMFNRQRQIDYWAKTLNIAPLVVAPYDAELFGHWWYEGPWFLDALFRKSSQQQDSYQVVHLADYLHQNPTHQVCQPAQSSWGAQGFHEFWLNSSNSWIYPHLHKATERMLELGKRDPIQPWEERALNQAARELLLAQASDWAFIMQAGTMVSYAERRTKSHLLRFNHLYEAIHKGELDLEWLEAVESMDNLFPHLNYRVFR